jgi:hypothetical protein
MDKLNSDDILQAEFNYIAQTAFQANEDRARATSFYLVTFSSFIAAIVTYRFDSTVGGADWVSWSFTILFAALAVMGFITVMQLARLRVAWFDSIRAMNQIKEYYIKNCDGLETAFAWRQIVAPEKFKINSVGFMLIIQVAILAAAAFGATVFFFTQSLTGNGWMTFSLVTGLAYGYGMVELYRHQMKSPN